jgi:hypothetical protein
MNVMTKTHAQFLEELRKYIHRENENNKKFCLSSSFCDGLGYAYQEILNKIEQFEQELINEIG